MTFHREGAERPFPASGHLGQNEEEETEKILFFGTSSSVQETQRRKKPLKNPKYHPLWAKEPASVGETL